MKEAVSLTLFSDIYMTAVLMDKSACQHVLRILTGSSSLQIKEVRTQYRISSLVSHDAVLDVLAEVLLFYISKTDIWKGQKTIYLADRQLYDSQVPVSYTHLDVYKRQPQFALSSFFLFVFLTRRKPWSVCFSCKSTQLP